MKILAMADRTIGHCINANIFSEIHVAAAIAALLSLLLLLLLLLLQFLLLRLLAI